MYTCNMHHIPVRHPPPSASRAAAVAGGEAKGLPRQGPTLLIAPAPPIGVIGLEHARGDLGWLARDQGSGPYERAR